MDSSHTELTLSCALKVRFKIKMKLVIFPELFCLVALAMATRRSCNNRLAVHEKRTSDATLWKRTSTLDQSLIIPLKVALA
jgi:hypothetical protein